MPIIKQNLNCAKQALKQAWLDCAIIQNHECDYSIRLSDSYSARYMSAEGVWILRSGSNDETSAQCIDFIDFNLEQISELLVDARLLKELSIVTDNPNDQFNLTIRLLKRAWTDNAVVISANNNAIAKEDSVTICSDYSARKASDGNWITNTQNIPGCICANDSTDVIKYLVDARIANEFGEQYKSLTPAEYVF